jgi:tetratricopeptide (TPR) repeat protein
VTQTPPIALGRTAQGQDLLAAIEAALETDTPTAVRLAQTALARGLESARVLTLVALQYEEDGRYADAMRLLDRAAGLDPKDASVWNSVGLCLIKQDRRGGAVAAFEHALALDPLFAQPYYNLGTTLEYLGDYEGAREQFQRAVHLFPDYADPLAGLATLSVRAGNWDDVRRYAQEALALSPFQPAAVSALATADVEAKQYQAAADRLSETLAHPGLDKFDRPSLHCLLGDALDGLGRLDEAFSEYISGKAAFREVHKSLYELSGNESQLDFARRMNAYFSAGIGPEWSAAAPLAPGEVSPARGHAFLVGFPRSGTTLLENVLASHPDVMAMDERANMREFEAAYIAGADALDHLGAISAAEASQRRSEYWARVRETKMAHEGKVVVDKMPLYTTKLPIIFKLFPGVKVLFALRDPRDVVFSCFRRPFQINSGMYQFVTLEGAARFYDAVMSLMETYKRVLPLDVHTIRYESFVADFEGEARAVCDFLGVEWSESLHDFAAVARERRIRTPSAAQVRAGLYSTGAGQWRRYARHLEPILPILQHWVERFGYDPT